MNVWRWLGLFFFIAAVTCFAGTRLPVSAGEKDKKVEKDKGDKDKGDKGKKDPPVKGGAEELKFTAFAPQSNGKPASEFYQRVTTETTQKMKVMGQEVNQEQKQTFYILWTPQALDKEKNYVVDQQVKAIMMNIDIGGNKIGFDSTLPEGKQPKNPMTDFFSALMKQKLTFHINPAGKEGMEVKEIDGRTDFIKSLADTNPAIKTLLDTIMSEAALKKMAEPTWWAVPNKSVAPGDTWSNPSVLDLGPIGKYDTTFKFTYDGKADKLQKIKIDATLTYSAPKDKAGLPFTIKEAKLEGKGSGEAYFDPATGRIDNSKLTMKLDGKLTIEVGNMATEISLNQDQTSTTKTFDKLPPEAETKKQ